MTPLRPVSRRELGRIAAVGVGATLLPGARSANANGTTVVVATHDKSLLASTNKRIIALEDGAVATN